MEESENVMDLFLGNEQVLPGDDIISKSLNKILLVVGGGIGAVSLSIGGLALAYSAKDKSYSIWNNDFMINLKRAVILLKWGWEFADPFLRKKGQDKAWIERIRYNIDQGLDIIDNFFKSKTILKLFTGM